ncbi:protein-(glutamine-N5) methyltransferase, release factor-specific [Chryseobacterium sp. 6424]|uniref:peptide chain release factor N(5)-glutamine methyltransferase n=1 Tax=Chryseobacterium sp. 6424 TaxID=2039166 RepID=UPI000EFC1F51|nr:peptide chain release factor N(5)-glutamine methyltransferase [Chryseobacterium sp. 6424]AYO57635.1 protein-(glutamine-N5) methyltransferase, release factor-specific [Chryseobacterium sp. 6424]
MTLQEIKNLYKSILSERYSDTETNTLFTLLAEEILKVNPVRQRQMLHDELAEETERQFTNYLSKLETGQPYQQVIGKTEFYGLQFFVNEHVLIPRPETEELLEIAISKIEDSFGNRNIRILDIGTGSGVIPIVLKKHFPEAEITSIDYSEAALEVARRNATQHQTQIRFKHQDYLNTELDECYEVIISNPPYIGLDEKEEISVTVKNFEPLMALFSPTENPLVFYEKIAGDALEHLAEHGLVLLEINQKLGHQTLDLFIHSFSEAHLVQDISDNDRFIIGKK